MFCFVTVLQLTVNLSVYDYRIVSSIIHVFVVFFFDPCSMLSLSMVTTTGLRLYSGGTNHDPLFVFIIVLTVVGLTMI